MRRIVLLFLLLAAIAGLGAQNTLSLNGINEAQFIYRTAEDSLNAYFRNSFGFNLGYRNFAFGMKFIAELPKYSTSQSDLLQDLDANRLSLGWKELYANYTSADWLFHAGLVEETFGSGIVFRSFEDIEFDQDNRVQGFKVKYDDVLRLKALYSAIESPTTAGKHDLAYGADAEYPVLDFLTLGASAVALRNLTAFSTYNQSDVFGGRATLDKGALSLSAEYSTRELYRRGPGLPSLSGSAFYGTASLNLGLIQLGGAFKDYDSFQYRLQDIPLANHHNETLADDLASGSDEQGFQGWVNYTLWDDIYFILDYAEAWSADYDKRMNDAYAGLEWTGAERQATLSYSHVEKVDDALSHWQQEIYPAFSLGLPAWGRSLLLNGEFKLVSKQVVDVESDHYEPKLQADLSLGKLSLSAGAQSWWEDFSSILDSRYWANLEAKYRLQDNTDLTLFAGKEAGGKVCRNGVCRYVAPFSGLRLELSTRF
jgi:hypothetical protein